jgi:hypothetical protein
MSEGLSTGEQRARAGLDAKGRMVRRGKPRSQDEVEVDGLRYRVVGTEERVDLPDAQLVRRREKFVRETRALHQMLRHERARQSAPDRLRVVISEMARLQTPRARSIQPAEPDARKDRPVLPPGGDDLALGSAHRDEVARMLRMISRAVERLEDLLDSHLGRGPARDYALMDSHEKNAVVLTDFVGWRPEEIEAFEPALGTARTHRWVREQWAADPSNHWHGGPYRGVCGHGPDQCTRECPPVRKKRALA